MVSFRADPLFLLLIGKIIADVCPVIDKPSTQLQVVKPNILLVLTDDLDLTLEGTMALPKTKALIGDQGVTAENWFVHTPVCCPSRAEILTGRFFHNLKTPSLHSEEPSCMRVAVGSNLSHPFYKKYYFAQHFQQAGYTIGFFGKHLNGQNTKCPPVGVDRWLINGGGQYINPSFTWAAPGSNSTHVQFNNCTDMQCYSTTVIGNASLKWITEHLSTKSPRKPFFSFVSVKAPHIQDGPGWPVAIPEKKYKSAFPSIKAPRQPNWNVSCPAHHWLIRQQPPMTQEQASHADDLYRARLQSLLTVDDLVDSHVNLLKKLGELHKTLILFTSDHGFRMGQFRMPQGKWNVYENDIRVPLYIRGPGLQAGTTLSTLGSHVDIMPTLLDLVGESIPDTMDGQSVATELKKSSKTNRTAVLVEYIACCGNVVRYEHLEDTNNNTFRALRVIDPHASEGQRNLKYVEFTDLRYNWNWTQEATEFEMFDLDTDPYELNNIYSTAEPSLKRELKQELKRMYQCEGPECRTNWKSMPIIA